MRFKRPPSESQPRPHRAVDVLQAIDTEHESESLFDPKRDIDPSTEKKLFQHLNDLRGRKEWREFLQIASSVSIVYPSHSEQYRLNPDEYEEVKTLLNNTIEIFREPYFSEDIINYEDDTVSHARRSFTEYVSVAVDYMTLYPEHKDDLQLDENNVADRLLEDLKNYRKDKLWLDYLFKIVQFLILFPDRKAPELTIDELDFKRIKKQLQYYSKFPLHEFHYLEMIACLCVICPDKKQELELLHDDINNRKVEFSKRIDRDDWHFFTVIAKYLTIVSADRAVITFDGRIRLVNKKQDLVKPRIPLPVRSKISSS